MESKKSESEESAKILPVAYSRSDYKKSNFLIGARYKSSILENKILAIASYKLSNNDYQMVNSQPTVTITDTEIIKRLKKKSGSFYNTLAKTAKKMQEGMIIGYNDPETGDFDYIALVTRVLHENGTLTIKFNPDMKDYLVKLKKNYAVLNIDIMCTYDSTYAFRLDELLRTEAYFPKGVTGKRIFKKDFGLTELKLKLGVIDPNVSTNKELILKYGVENISDKKIEQQFARWDSFRKQVIDVGVKEINEKSPDMTVTYGLIYGGKGSSVQRIIFTIDFEAKTHGNMGGNNADGMTKPEKMEHIRESLAMNEKLKVRFLNSEQIEELCSLIGWDMEVFDEINRCVEANANEINDTFAYYMKMARCYPDIADVSEEDEDIEEETENEGEQKEPIVEEEPLKKTRRKSSKKIGLSEDDTDAFYDKVIDLIDEKLSMKDIREISQKSEYDIETVKNAYEYAKKMGCKDLVPYLKDTIKNRYWERGKVETKKPKVSGSAQRYNERFSQRDYSDDEMKEIERNLRRAASNHKAETEE